MERAELLQRCKAVGTGTWSDALDECGISGVVRGLAQRSGRGRFAGFAVTARERAGALGSFPRAEFGVGQMIAAIEPGDVLMADVGGADISTFGGLAALAIRKRGTAAVVIDGACRDVEEIRATDLWLASRSVTPTTGKTRLKLEALGEPVTIGGIAVRPVILSWATTLESSSSHEAIWSVCSRRSSACSQPMLQSSKRCAPESRSRKLPPRRITFDSRCAQTGTSRPCGALFDHHAGGHCPVRRAVGRVRTQM
jgi:regulator of RNase E activity RraA